MWQVRYDKTFVDGILAGMTVGTHVNYPDEAGCRNHQEALGKPGVQYRECLTNNLYTTSNWSIREIDGYFFVGRAHSGKGYWLYQGNEPDTNIVVRVTSTTYRTISIAKAVARTIYDKEAIYRRDWV